jgi:AcrR family transcriptional regulator
VSPRPRKASDDEVFAAAMRVMERVGPHQLTLAEIASEAGLTAGALVQRFGSKRALLLALMGQFADSAPGTFEALRASDSSPIATLYAYGDCMARMGESPDALAHNLAWLQQDLTDPDFRQFMLKHARASRRELQQLVSEAIAAGELVPSVDAAALARAIEVTVGGSLMSWAVHQEGTATRWIRHDLDTLLRPLLSAKARRQRQPRREGHPVTRKRSRR